MRKQHRHFTDEQRREILREVEEHGLAITLRKHGIYAKSIYRWRERFAGQDGQPERRLNTPEEQELRRLRMENQQLKEIIAEKELALRIKDSLLKKTSSRGKTD